MLYLLNGEGYFVGEVNVVAGVTYPNSTDVSPDFKKYSEEIYSYKWDRCLKKWEYEYRGDFLDEKARELGLEVTQVSQMSEEDLRSGKLPVLDTIKNTNEKIKKGAKK